MKAANLVLRFLLELGALGALGYWGATAPVGTVVRVVLGAGLPFAAAAFWGMFVAPRARVALPTAARMALGLAVFAVAAAALADRGHGRLAAGFAAAAVVNAAFMLVWRQDRVIPPGAA
ncbi:MAG TPA: YrdB family protein [Gemmatimonadaceae bacterium]|nr:YrdB family protein [Gemmatimonadaceae bacterium]